MELKDFKPLTLQFTKPILQPIPNEQNPEQSSENNPNVGIIDIPNPEDTLYENNEDEVIDEEEENIEEEKAFLPEEFIEQVDKKLRLFARKIRRRARDKYDNVIAVTAYPGTGKTTLVMILSYLIDKNYSLDKNVCYIPEAWNIKKKYYEVRKYGVLHIDEASKSLHKHQWFSAPQQALNTLFDTERQGHYKTTIMIMPRFQNFTENFRNFRINYWIHIVDRGLAICYKKDEDKDVKDPWHLDENYKKKQSRWYYKRRRIWERSMPERVRAESQTENYWFWFTFPELPKEVMDKFMELREASKNEKPPENEGEADPEKEKRRIKDIKNDISLFKSYSYIKKIKPQITDFEAARYMGLSKGELLKLIERYTSKEIPPSSSNEENEEKAITQGGTNGEILSEENKAIL